MENQPVRKKRMSREEKLKQAEIDLCNQMFVIAGHEGITYEDVKDREDAWHTEWTMTAAQNEEWKKWGVAYLKKNLRMNTFRAERQMAWIALDWGLKLSDFPS